MTVAENLNIKIDVDVSGEGEIASLIGELEALDQKLESIQKKSTIDIDTNVDESALENAEVDGDSSSSSSGWSSISDIKDAFVNGDIDRHVMEGALGQYMEDNGMYDDDGGDGGDDDDKDKDSDILSSLGRGLKGFDSKHLNKLGDAFENINPGRLNLKMSQFYDLIASLLPLIGVFVGAIPAAVAGLITLAGAAVAAAGGIAAIGGLALLGYGMQQSGGGMPSMESFKKLRKRIRKTLFEAIAPIAQKLAPLVERSLGKLEKVMNDVATAFEQNGVFQVMRRNALGFMEFMGDYIPYVVASMGRLVDAFEGVFAEVGSYLKDTDIVGGLIEFTYNILPTIRAIVRMLINAIPAILRISTSFLQMSKAILKVVGFLYTMITALTWLTDKSMGAFLATLFVALSTMAIFGTLLSINAKGLIWFGRSLISAVQWLTGYTIAQGGANVATAIFIGLLGALTGGLLLATAAAAFDKITNKVRNFTEELNAANAAMSSLGGSTPGDLGGTLSAKGSGSGGYGGVNVYNNSQSYKIDANSPEAANRAGRNATYRGKRGSDNRHNELK